MILLREHFAFILRHKHKSIFQIASTLNSSLRMNEKTHFEARGNCLLETRSNENSHFPSSTPQPPYTPSSHPLVPSFYSRSFRIKILHYNLLQTGKFPLKYTRAAKLDFLSPPFHLFFCSKFFSRCFFFLLLCV